MYGCNLFKKNVYKDMYFNLNSGVLNKFIGSVAKVWR